MVISYQVRRDTLDGAAAPNNRIIKSVYNVYTGRRDDSRRR